MVEVRQGQDLGSTHGKEAEQTDEADVQALKGRQEGVLNVSFCTEGAGR
jgi:hypothetical protein